MSFSDTRAAMTAPGFMDFTTNWWKYHRLRLCNTQRMIFHYQVFNRLISKLYLLSFNVLCKFVVFSITNERKLRTPVLAVSLFPTGYITVLFVTLFSLPSMRIFLWAVAKWRSFKNHSLGRMNCYLDIVSTLYKTS